MATREERAGTGPAAVQHVHGHDPRLSPGYVHATDPGHGQPVTFQPGELLPDWVLADLAAGAGLAVEGQGVFRLVPAPGKGKR